MESELTMTYTGNQLKKVTDVATNIGVAGSMDIKDYTNTDTEYTYNRNGAMNKDLNKGITRIQYNSLNLPRQMVINSSSVKAKNYYTYTASGVKLKTEQRYDPTLQNSPVQTTTPATDGLANYKTTDYVGNIIYETEKKGTAITNNTRILVDGGYYEGGVYYYYLSDHLGNNRVVANQNGTVIQKNHYYPFGTAFAEGTAAEQGKQPYKYNGKELDQLLGLNLYDYSARYYESAIGRFTTVDPMAEKYYSISPYVYCNNNPLKFIDPTGMSYTYNWDKGIYQDENGKEVEWETVNNYIHENEEDDPPGFLGGIAQPFKNLWNAITHPGQTVEGAINYLTNTTFSEHIGNTLNQMSTGSFSVMTPSGITLRSAKDNLLLRSDLKNGTNYYWSAQGELLGNLLLEGATTYLGGKVSPYLSLRKATTVYRAVDAAEKVSINSSKSFLLNTGGTEVKYFAKTLEDAHWYGSRLYPNGYSIIKGTVSSSVNVSAYWYPYVDIGAYAFPKTILPNIKPIIP